MKTAKTLNGDEALAFTVEDYNRIKPIAGKMINVCKDAGLSPVETVLAATIAMGGMAGIVSEDAHKLIASIVPLMIFSADDAAKTMQGAPGGTTLN